MDQLARDFESQPVVFLEHDVDNPTGDRISRWWIAWGTGGSVTLPMVMVDSGFQISSGYQDFYNVFRDMVEDALEQPALAAMDVTKQRIGNSYRFTVELTNHSGVTLNSVNGAKVHAIVYEDIHHADTDRWVRGGDGVNITDLAPGATATYVIDVPLSGVNWDKLHTVVLADFRPDGPSGTFSTLQAVHD